MITFPAPASSNAACGFPALRFPACFTSRVMRPIQPSPSRISFASGRAVRSAPFSSRLCLPCRQSRYRQQGRFPPPALPGFTGTTSPSATLSPVSRFPGAAGYTAYLCSADFSTGRGGLLQLLSASLSPYRRYHPGSAVAPQPVCATPCCFRPRLEDSASGPSVFRGHLCVHSRYGPATRRPPLTVVVSMGWVSCHSGLPPASSTRSYGWRCFDGPFRVPALISNALPPYSLLLHVYLSGRLRSAPFSSRPPMSVLQTAGPLPSTGVNQPLRHPLACQPISRCCRLYGLPLLRRFLNGARRASPVA